MFSTTSARSGGRLSTTSRRSRGKWATSGAGSRSAHPIAAPMESMSAFPATTLRITPPSPFVVHPSGRHARIHKRSCTNIIVSCVLPRRFARVSLHVKHLGRKRMEIRYLKLAMLTLLLAAAFAICPPAGTATMAASSAPDSAAAAQGAAPNKNAPDGHVSPGQRGKLRQLDQGERIPYQPLKTYPGLDRCGISAVAVCPDNDAPLDTNKN